MHKNHFFSMLVVLFCSSALAAPPDGEWGEFVFDLGDPAQGLPPIVSEHMIHLPTGKILVLAENTVDCDSQTRARVYLWTPPLGDPPQPVPPGGFLRLDVPACRTWITCTGHAFLDDAGIIIAGAGDFWLSPVDSNLFSPFESQPWNNPYTPPNTNWPRWYPTCTTLPDGRVVAFSGKMFNEPYVATTPEVFDPDDPSSWTPKPTADTLAQNPPWLQDLYPNIFVLPDGNLVDASFSTTSYFFGVPDAHMLNTTTTTPSEAWEWGPALPPPPQPIPTVGREGTSVTYAPGKIMKCGGGWPIIDAGQPQSYSALAGTWVVDLNGADPNNPPPWQAAGSMQYPRFNHNLVIMADGKVLALGGHSQQCWYQPPPPASGYYVRREPVFRAEIWEPATGQWTLQPESDPFWQRMYHTAAVLLRDGRVVFAGGSATEPNTTCGPSPAGSPNAQIFSPPYITVDAPRPSILSAPAQMPYGQPYTIAYQFDRPITRACLIRLAASTHGYDQSQRYVPLKIISQQAPPTPTPSIVVNAPADGKIAPPGPYMLFILYEYEYNLFVPCELAAYVLVGP